MAIFTHVCVGTNDLDKANKFYTAALGAIGINNLGAFGPTATLYGAQGPEFIVLKPGNGLPSTYANGGTIGFKCKSPEQVREFHDTAVANGGL